MEELNSIKSTKKDLRSFGFIIGFILLAVGGVYFYKEKELFVNFISVGSIFVGLGFIFPIALKPIHKIWMIFAVVIGWVMTRVILSVLFYSIITILGIFARLLRKDFLNLKTINCDSYWNNRNSEYELNQDYEKQF